MRGDGWAGYLEGRERMDVIKTARPQWMNLNVSDTARLDKFFDHTGWEKVLAEKGLYFRGHRLFTKK